MEGLGHFGNCLGRGYPEWKFKPRQRGVVNADDASFASLRMTNQDRPSDRLTA
jgi:hypothetical protein